MGRTINERTMMTRIVTKDKVLQSCIKQLTAIGCNFIILDYAEGGASWNNGNLELKVPEAPRIRKRGTVNRTRWNIIKPEIQREISKMQVGDVRVFNVPTGESIDAFRSLVCNLARLSFTEEGCTEQPYTTCANKEKTSIELLRIL